MTTETPLDGVELLLADLDGVIYRGPDPIPYAVEGINRASSSMKVGYITNNAARTDVSVAAHLTDLGLTVAPEEVVTSSQAAVKLLANLVPAGSTILVVGGEGLRSELEKAGFVCTDSAIDGPAAVAQGFAPEVAWTNLAEAAFALGPNAPGGEIPWIATNNDWTIPQARGTAPGNGTLVSAVHTAVGRFPVVAGKPEVAIFEAALERFAAASAIVVGDRLDTDIRGANRAGLRSALVLTGIDQPKQVLAAATGERPQYILEDCRGLFEPYPQTLIEETDGIVITTVGDATVARRGGDIRIIETGTGLNLLRAGAATIWNSGLSIYGLDVPTELHSK